jgi:short subunit dehydrogenase-like uncharacterized protein
MPAREFDIILYGATGFTGRLVAEHLLKTYGVGRDLAWAIAGRGEAKLKEVRALIGAPASLALVQADASDPASLAAMAQKAKVIISTVGPYQLYGDGLVAACAKAGTDYVDLTGESNWIAKMIGAHEAEAKASGARIVFSCGFDSIPFDCGVLFVEEQAKKKFGAYAPRVRGRMRAMQGGISGGTIASGMATQMAAAKDPSIGKMMANPFALTPGFDGPAQPDGNSTYEDKVTGAWVGPFMMSAINTKAVHRANFLLGHPWGKDFQYDEMTMLPGPPSGGAPAPGFAFGGANMPKPGEGPSQEEREKGFYDVLMIAEYPDGRTLRCAVKGDKDPGYGSTSRMLGESAMCLLRDVPREKTPGGCWTAAAAMGEALIKRLEAHAGVNFIVEA